METQNKPKKEKLSKLIGLVATFVVHGLIVLLLYLMYFNSSQTEQLESGILVMAGVDEMGNGEEMAQADEPNLKAEPQPQQTQPSPATTPQPDPKPSPQEPLLAQNDDNAPYVAEQKKKEEEKLKEQQRQQQEEAKKKAEELKRQQEEAKRKAEEEARKAAEEAERERKRQLAASTVGGALNNNGTGGQTGLQGSANGNSNQGATSGHAGFGDWDVNGRQLMGKLPKPTFNINESGKIVIIVNINAQGEVTRAEVSPTGTTIANQQLRKEALEAAKKARFNAVGGTSIVPGKITYYFDSNN